MTGSQATSSRNGPAVFVWNLRSHLAKLIAREALETNAADNIHEALCVVLANWATYPTYQDVNLHSGITRKQPQSQPVPRTVLSTRPSKAMCWAHASDRLRRASLRMSRPAVKVCSSGRVLARSGWTRCDGWGRRGEGEGVQQ